MSKTAPDTDVVVGVDTHKLTHTAVAINALGVRLGSVTVPANGTGYQALQAWAQSLGELCGNLGDGLKAAYRGG